MFMALNDEDVLTGWIDLLIDILALNYLCPKGDSRENR